MSFIYKIPKKIYKYVVGGDAMKKEDAEHSNQAVDDEIVQANGTVYLVQRKTTSTDVYNHYPGDRSQYPMGTPSQYNFPKIDFQAYQAKEVITASSAKDESAPFFATSGTLTCEMVDGVKDGFTTTHNFRMLCNPTDPYSKKRVRYTDFETLFIGRLNKWQSGAPNWSGFHIFARYQTEDDLYVASLRKDGQVVIKKKVGGVYSTLAKADFGDLKLGEEYFFQFEVNGNLLTYKINGKPLLQVTDNDLEWGTTGLRFDYADAVIDYLRIASV